MTQSPPRVYLDNAATSWPKPDTVYQRVQHAMRELGAPAGRSAYAEAGEVERGIQETRRQVGRTIGDERPERIAFAANGTDALNLAIHGVVRPGDHVVTTAVEHNSVLRPLRFLEEHRQVRVTRIDCSPDGTVDPDEVVRAVRDDTRMVVCIHASNVTGALLPVAAIGNALQDGGPLFLVDAAQSLGHVAVHVRDMGCDLLAAPGHKGLLGPLGTGVLWVGDRAEPELTPLRQGGTGTQSEDDRQPWELPARLESGNHTVPGILGLGEGLRFLSQRGWDTVRAHERRLTARLLDGWAETEKVTIHGPRDADRQVGVVSISLAGYDPQEVASLLDAAYRIQVRSGLHCAPRMHKALGTLQHGGSVRFSVGCFNTEQEIDLAIQAVREIVTAPLSA